MSRVIANVQVSTDTFYAWVSKTNEIADTFKETVTVLKNTSGDMTTGNGFVNGYFGANTLTASYISGGNVQSKGNLVITTNTALGNSSSQIKLTHNGISETTSANLTTTTSDLQTYDTFLKTEYRAAKYIISIKNTDSSYYQATELMVLHDGTSAYSTEYATLLSDVTLGTFSVDIDSNNVRLRITPTFNNNEIKLSRTLLAV